MITTRRSAYRNTIERSLFRLPNGWFDIEALKPPGTAAAQTRVMCKLLLIERFHLRSHFEDTPHACRCICWLEATAKSCIPGAMRKASGCSVGTMDRLFYRT